MLLHCGSDPLAVSHNDETAQQLASEEEHRDTATILQTATAKVTGSHIGIIFVQFFNDG